MPLPPEQERRFNEAAEKARIEFAENWKNWSAEDLCRWVNRWYYPAAYDRLCRIMREAVTLKLELVVTGDRDPERLAEYERLLKEADTS